LGKSPSFAMSFQMTQRAGMSAAGTLFGQIAKEDHAEHALFTPAMLTGAVVSIAGILLAYALHLRNRRKAEEIAAGLQPLTGWLEAKWYVDEIYDAAIVSPLRQLGQLFFAVDRFVIDGIVWIVSFVPQAFGWTLKLSSQRGNLQGYAVTMLFGIAVIL